MNNISLNSVFKKMKNPDVFIPVLIFIMILFLITIKLFKSNYEKFSEYIQYGTYNNPRYSTEQPRQTNRSNKSKSDLNFKSILKIYSN